MIEDNIILRVIICNSQERNVKKEEQGRSVTWLFIYLFFKYYIYRVITSLSWVQACDLGMPFLWQSNLIQGVIKQQDWIGEHYSL